MKEKQKIKSMIMTLGGSPNPLIKSIVENKPERVVFMASHDSVTLSGQILQSLDPKPKVEFEITEDPNLLYECFKTARRCIDRIKKSQVSPNQVIVDYTGGTKVMTSALILAATGYKFRYNYVGGDKRNKNGLGTVRSGHEKLYAEMSPWAIFAEEERRQVVTLFNSRRYSAIIQIINNAFERELPIQIRGYFRFIEQLAWGFLKWDQFEHKGALKRLDKGLELLSEYLEVHPDPLLEKFYERVSNCRVQLDRILEKTDGIKTFHQVLIDDLLNNARRKIEDKRYDDAAARIYRALELYGQVLFEQTAGFTNDKVKLEVIPDEIRDEFVRKYKDSRSQYLKLPLSATFTYLNAKGHEAGARYFKWEREIKKIQSNRNSSILAHGIKPVTEKAINSIFAIVSEFVQSKVVFDFPKLP